MGGGPSGRPGSRAEQFYAPWVQGMMAQGNRELGMDAMGSRSGRVRVRASSMGWPLPGEGESDT